MSYFKKYHCLIDKQGYKNSTNAPLGLSVEKKFITKAYFDYLIHKVGNSWQWPLRPKYMLEYDSLTQRLKDAQTELFIFKLGQKLQM